MNEKRIYSASFQKIDENGDAVGMRHVNIVACNFIEAAEIASERRKDGELIGLGENHNPLVIAG